MNIELTEEQRRQLEGYPEAPVRLIDAESRREYVLVSAEVYDAHSDSLAVIDQRRPGQTPPTVPPTPDPLNLLFYEERYSYNKGGETGRLLRQSRIR